MQINRNQFIKFLVASDNHLGANDHVGLKSNRYQDAFDAFEEVLQIAQQQCVDFVILGGDLFHEKHPTEHCLLKSIDTLQKYVFGDNFGGIQMEINSLNYQPNFTCSNFNVQLPIFIINGNHDDIITERNECVSILDILHESKYLNYIGKITDQALVTIKPIVLVKNNQKIALYGLGYMKDYQLCKLITEDKLILDLFDEQNFNILIIHQNKNKGTHFNDEKNFIDPIYFKKYKIDLMIWGHEHEAIYNLEQCEHFKIFFPGSTVATSLIEYEALIKQVGIFTLTKNQMKFESIKLEKSYRPIIHLNFELNELVKQNNTQVNLTTQELAEKLLFDSVEKELINYYQTNKYRQKKPLLRVKVEYTGFELMKMRFLETKFGDKVANPDQIFKFWEKKQNFLKQIEKRKEQAEQLNQQFDNIIKSKVEFTSQNQTIMSEFSLLLQNKLNQQSFSIIDQGDFINILENFMSSTNKEKNNLFGDLYLKSIEKFKGNVQIQYINRINQILKRQKEYQDQLIFRIRDAMMKDFEQNCKSDNFQSDCTDYAFDITSVLTKFQEEYRNDSQRQSLGQSLGQSRITIPTPSKNNNNNSNNYNNNNNNNNNNSSRQFSFTSKQEQQGIKDAIIIEDDSISQKGQTQTSIFDDEQIREEQKNKKGTKKRKPAKKEEDIIIIDNKPKQQIILQPFKKGMNKFL